MYLLSLIAEKPMNKVLNNFEETLKISDFNSMNSFLYSLFIH